MSENGSSLEVLSRAESLRLLASTTVGRVVYTADALPAVTPVNFAMQGSAVVFRTASGSRLARATDDQVVAFEADRIDEVTQSGWSVVITGIAEAVRDASELLRVEQLGLVSWADGARDHFVRIVPGAVTGRRIAAAVRSHS
ncbi:MAG: pyridoxamine 5'-phosphate oxidase family protein [Actinomycetes bacterium]